MSDFQSDWKDQQDYKVVNAAVDILSAMCAANRDIVIDKLTGYLWDEEEAGDLKRAYEKGE